MIGWFILLQSIYRFTPICVASIVCSKIIIVPNLWKTLEQVALLIVISISGFLFYQLVIAQMIYFLVVKKNPFKYYLSIMPAVMTGFATASKYVAKYNIYHFCNGPCKLRNSLELSLIPTWSLIFKEPISVRYKIPIT